MKENKKTKSYPVAVINKVEILAVENLAGEKFIPIKPICELLGIDFSSQHKKLNREPFLNSTMVIMTTVGADKKDREMVCLPYKYIFGWLFKIDLSRVNEESKEIVMQYQIECYDALYDNFSSYADYYKEKLKRQEDINERLIYAKDKLREAKEEVKQTENESKNLAEWTLQDFLSERAQQTLPLEFDKN